jgi:hypothetical protein
MCIVVSTGEQEVCKARTSEKAQLGPGIYGRITVLACMGSTLMLLYLDTTVP